MKTSAMNLRRDPARTASRKTTVRKKREAQATAKAFKGRWITDGVGDRQTIRPVSSSCGRVLPRDAGLDERASQSDAPHVELLRSLQAPSRELQRSTFNSFAALGTRTVSETRDRRVLFR